MDMGHGDSYGFIQKLVKNNDYIYLNKRCLNKIKKELLIMLIKTQRVEFQSILLDIRRVGRN